MVIAPALIYLNDYNMKVIILGMGISLISTLISVIIIGQKLYLYFLNTQDAKDSRSGESDEYSVCKSPISVTTEKVIKNVNNIKIPTTTTPIKAECNPIKVSVKNTLLRPSIHRHSHFDQMCENQSNCSAYVLPSENNSLSIKHSLHSAFHNGQPMQRHSVVSTTSLVSSKYMIKGEKIDAAKSNLSKSNTSNKSKGFDGKSEENNNMKMSRLAKNSQYLSASPSDSTTLPPIKGIFTPASLDYKSDSSNRSNKSNKSESRESCLSGGTLKVGNSNTVIVHEKTLIVAKSNEAV